MVVTEPGAREPESDVREPPEPELAFSHQAAWVVARPSLSGHIVTITCSGRSLTWLSGDQGEQGREDVRIISDVVRPG